jgi:ATP-dependent Clp endopeptidase proteolytic subunit ClpP
LKNHFGRAKKNEEMPMNITLEQPATSSAGDISHQDCTIQFYSDIDDSTINSLIKLIREKTFLSQGIQCQFELPTPPPLHLHIQSYGGSIFSGIAAMEHIRNNKVPIHTYIDGTAMSAGTFLSCVGAKRYMYKESTILIHQLSTGFYGKFSEMMDEVQNCKLLMDKIKSFYKQYTKLEDKMLNSLLKRDLYLDSKDCMKYGLVDQII